jgi:hypothetical protein
MKQRRSWDEAMCEAVHLSAMGFEEQGIALMREWHEECRRRRAQREAEDRSLALAPDMPQGTDGVQHDGR